MCPHDEARIALLAEHMIPDLAKLVNAHDPCPGNRRLEWQSGALECVCTCNKRKRKRIYRRTREWPHSKEIDVMPVIGRGLVLRETIRLWHPDTPAYRTLYSNDSMQLNITRRVNGCAGLLFTWTDEKTGEKQCCNSNIDAQAETVVRFLAEDDIDVFVAF